MDLVRSVNTILDVICFVNWPVKCSDSSCLTIPISCFILISPLLACYIWIIVVYVCSNSPYYILAKVSLFFSVSLISPTSPAASFLLYTFCLWDTFNCK